MKPAIAALTLIATSLLSLPALAGKCTLGSDQYGRTTVNLDGKMIAAYNQQNDAITGASKLKQAGLCSMQATRCSLGTDVYGRTTVLVDEKAIATYNQLDDALAGVGKLGRAGICYQQSTCSLGTDVYGRTTTISDGKVVGAFNQLDEAIASLTKMSDAGLCGDRDYHGFDHHGSAEGCELRGNSVFIYGGAKLIDTYQDQATAIAVYSALQKAGACSN